LIREGRAEIDTSTKKSPNGCHSVVAFEGLDGADSTAASHREKF
jgi:hypothetical protein